MKYLYIFCLVITLLFCSCGRQDDERTTHMDTAMGTIIQQTVYSQSGSGEDIVAEVMFLLTDLEKDTLSWREEESQIGQINQWADKEAVVLSESMQQYMEVIAQVWTDSKGALDVTIGSVTRLWNIDDWAKAENSDLFELPSAKVVEAALKRTGFDKVNIANGKITMPDTWELDLGAVGKGIACDEVAEYLETQSQVSGAVISVGGSILIYGEKSDKSDWKVAINHPRKEGTSIAVLKLKGNCCVSTSGDYERYVEKDGMRYHHIIDPKTGYPADSGLISVTIVSQSGILSDALSTACFVLGKDKGLELVQKYGAEAYMIDENMKVYMTEGMDKMLVLQ